MFDFCQRRSDSGAGLPGRSDSGAGREFECRSARKHKGPNFELMVGVNLSAGQLRSSPCNSENQSKFKSKLETESKLETKSKLESIVHKRWIRTKQQQLDETLFDKVWPWRTTNDRTDFMKEKKEEEAKPDWSILWKRAQAIISSQQGRPCLKMAACALAHEERGKGRQFILKEYDPVSKRKESVLEAPAAASHLHKKFKGFRYTDNHRVGADREELSRDVPVDGGVDADRDESLHQDRDELLHGVVHDRFTALEELLGGVDADWDESLHQDRDELLHGVMHDGDLDLPFLFTWNYL